MILVLGTAEDQHAAAIYNKIVARGNRVSYFDPRLYPREMTVTFDGALPMTGTVRYRDGQSAIDLSCLLYTSPSPRDRQKSRMPSSA